MATKNKQDELFIINDINMEINPSDVQVMDDNWVMEDSYLRSKAVFCYRSKYSATKVVLSIPFQITHLNEVEASALNNTYNCIRLITELSSYPFCFIRNQRIRTYISPTSISTTNYMMFAVDEINLVQDASASNMLFLEVVLQYFNHQALIQDFEFKSNLNFEVVNNSDYSKMSGSEEQSKTTEKNASQKQLDKVFKNNKKSSEQKRIIEVPNLVCSSLQDSTIWKKYIRPKESRVYSELIRTGLLQTSYSDTRNTHPAMRVKLMAPLMFVINEDEENFDDGRLVNNDCKVITVTNINHYDNGTYENLLNTIAKQDFSGDAAFENQTIFSTNSENQIKQGELTTRASREEENKPKTGEINNPFYDPKTDKGDAPVAEGDKPTKPNMSGSSSVFIQWQGDNIEDLQMGITSIKVSRKNKLVSHQISSFKHPVIQYMGKYPTTVSMTMNSVNQDIYSDDETYNSNVFIKQILNILDYNKSNIPEAEAYNFLKIRSLATLVMGCENYVPSQSVVSASANQQGVENIIYSFYETDMTSFIEDSKVKASGKLSTNNSTAKVTEMMVRWLTEFTKIFPDIMNNKTSSDTYKYSLDTFKLIVQLTMSAYEELGFEKNKINEALSYAVELLPDLRPNNNILKTVEVLPKDINPKELSKYTLHTKASKYITVVQENPEVAKLTLISDMRNNVTHTNKVEVSRKNDKAVDVSLYNIFINLIPFMTKVLLLRQSALEGKSAVNIGGVNFKESGKYGNLLLGVVSRLEAGLRNGEQAAAQSIDSEEVRQFFEDFSTDYSNTFFGYNYEDLSLEDLALEGYDRNTDLLIQNVDPFFFLVERTHLDGTELMNAYERMFAQSENIAEIPKTMNDQDNEAKDNPDITAQTLRVEYRKLKEVEYNKINFDNSLSGSSDYSLIMSGSNGRLNKEPPIDSKYVSAIERALKHYGYQNDHNFRQLVYSFLHAESTNGTDSKAFDENGAQGLFQLTDIAVAQLMMINNKVIDSQGTALPSNRDENWAKSQAPSQRPKLRTDHFFNACSGIEYLQYVRKNYSEFLTIDGKQHPVLMYIGYNLGPGSLQEVHKILTGKSSTAPVALREIQKQNASGVIWNGNHKETVESYIKVISNRSFSFNNVPESLRPDSLASKAESAIIGIVADPVTRKKEASNILKNANDYSNTINSNKGPLIFKQNNEKVKEIDKTYENFKVIPSKADKTNFVTAGTYMTGYVVGRQAASTEDGDTFDFRDGKTGKTIQIRLYGIDAPETTHLTDSEKKGLKGKELGMAEVLGQKAKEELSRMAFGKTVTIQDMGEDTTKGRRVAKLILSDGVDPALVLLRNGLGFVPDKFISDGAYKKAETEARENNRGIWKVPSGIVFKPRERENKGGTPIPLSNSDVERSKTPESLRFTNTDFETAKKVNGPKLNNYQPVLGGPFPISSPFGPRRSGMHKGIDVACPSGTVVIAAASGLAVFKNDPNGYGWYVEIDHGNGFITRYAHLSKSYIPVNGKKVQAGEKLGLSGGRSVKGGASVNDPGRGNSNNKYGHLHYEVRYKGTPVNPLGTRLLTEYKAGDPVGQGNTTLPPIDVEGGLASILPRNGVTDENTVYNEDELAKAIFERMNKYVNLGLKTSLPAIKVYITIGNENDKFWLNTLKGGIQYYELKGIKSFSMACNNDNNPVDIVVMDIADPSFLNTDAFMGLKKMQGISPNNIGTDYETQFTNDNILLKAGLKLHIRVGYGNNISKLDTIFNGTITDINVTNPQNVQVICEGFGKELLGEVFAPVEPQMLNDQDDHMSTSGVIGESLMAKCITHFGYSSGFWANTFKGLNDPEDRALQPGRFSFSYSWFVDSTGAQYKDRRFMNIFAPEIEAVDEVYKDQIPFYRNTIKAFSGLYTQGYPFSVYKMTPWDCLKQMEYRHPNTIIKPKFFEDRMTLFYGVKEQMYFAKDLNRSMQIMAAKSIEDGNTNDYTTKDYYEKRRERMLPAVDMHLVTSSHNLISNGLRLNSTYSTVTSVAYTDKPDSEDVVTPWKMKSQKIKMDDNIFSWDLREKTLTLSSCVSKYMAFCYGTTDLKKEAEKMYSGKILIIGNPTIKAGDYVFLDDSEKRMVGLILVRECNHHFDDKRGFITEIVPGQYVEAANFLYSSLWFKLMCSSKIVTSKLRNISKVNYSAKDFNMIYDYLTIMNQLIIALDKKADLSPVGLISEDYSYAAATGSVTALSLYVTNQLAKILGVKPYNKVGIALGTGPGKYLKSFYALNKEWSGFLEFGEDVAKWLKVTEAYDKIGGKITGAKQMIGGSKFAKYAETAKNSIKTAMQSSSTRAEGTIIGKAFSFTGRLLFSPFRFSGSATSRVGITAAKVLARSMLIGLVALPVAGIAAVVLDIVAIFAIQWAFDKMEENKLIRQPLLLFPLVRHGKPYTAGMAGLKRNSWWNSNKEEWAKTIDQVKKTSTIIAENAKLNGSEGNLFIQLLDWYGEDRGSERNGPVTYSTDLTGNQIKLNRNGEPIVTSPDSVEKKKELDRLIMKEYDDLTKEQKNAQRLKEQLQKVTSDELGRSPNLEVRNP